jgi:hypothetical protein
MDINIQKEEFSYAYINSIVSAAGFSQVNQTHSMDMKSVDITIQSSDTPFPKLDVQVKSTESSDIIDIGNNYIKYDLKVINYNQLIDKGRILTPIILILVLVPKKIDDWVIVDDINKKTVVQKCAYWISLKGQNPTTNKNNIRIKIPLTNILTPDSLKLIMGKIGRREEL